MNALRRRLDALAGRLRPTTPCPTHPAAGCPPGTDWRSRLHDALRAFSPDPEDRAAYRAEQEALADTPPCERCGWRPFAVLVDVTSFPNWWERRLHAVDDDEDVA